MVRAVATGSPGGGTSRRRPWPSALSGVVLPVALVIVLVPVPPPGGGSGGSTAPPPGSYALYPPLPAPARVPIQHIVIVMQENHAYDNYFGTYCRAYGPYCDLLGNGTPPGTCEPLYPQYPKIGCDPPFRYANASSLTRDLDHARNASLTAFDNGTNLGFVPAEKAGNLPMGYYDWHAIGDYWQMAEQYALGDNFFSSAMSYSLANHWYLMAGASPNVAVNEYVASASGFTPSWGFQSLYLNESNATPAIDDLLVNSSASWSYFDFALPPTYDRAIHGGQTFNYWNPLAAKAESYQTALTPHFVDRTTFLAEAANGTLPNVSWVLPTVKLSEHPPNNVTNGEQWVMNVTNALEASPEWNSSAMFITWDEYGGFYDSVPPPVVDGVGLSFRVPLLVVSPYTRLDYVDHQFGDFESLLKLVEWRFGLTHLTGRDQNATLPLNAFDFNATPRAPISFGPAQGASYPTALQALPAPPPPTNLTVRPIGGGARITWTPPHGGTAVTYYRLNYYPKGTPAVHTIRVDGAADGFVLAGLGANTTYYLTLQSVAGTNSSSVVLAHVTTPGPNVLSPRTVQGITFAGSGLRPAYQARPVLLADPRDPD